MRNISIVLLLVFVASVGSAETADLDLLVEWMTGSFSSRQQSLEDEAYFDIRPCPQYGGPPGQVGLQALELLRLLRDEPGELPLPLLFGSGPSGMTDAGSLSSRRPRRRSNSPIGKGSTVWWRILMAASRVRCTLFRIPLPLSAQGGHPGVSTRSSPSS